MTLLITFSLFQITVHRIGQTKTVHVYRLIAGGTVEERLIERADKKLLLDQMVNRERDLGDASTKVDDNDGLTLGTMLKDIKFGSSAVFGDSSLNILPTSSDIDFITDRMRNGSESRGKLQGNAHHNVESFDLGRELSDGQVFRGIDFRQLRNKKENLIEKNVPQVLRGIPRLSLDQDSKRKISNRIIMLSGKDSGYGAACVPVLSSNNYDLDKGESSVFERELSKNAREKFAVLKKTPKQKIPEHQDTCQICGDGGLLHLCSRCPVAFHKECWPHVTNLMSSCPHHWCSICQKPNRSAGGLLYPCQSCPNAYCEDCLPIENDGFRFLGPCDRFSMLGFDSLKYAVYIHCSSHCEKIAKMEFGWTIPPDYNRSTCPVPMDLSADFAGGNVAPASNKRVVSPGKITSDADMTISHAISTSAVPDMAHSIPEVTPFRPDRAVSNTLFS
jgi:SWI/SNF-related matrix-associated actin-dependent regulator of chromatin subfamily A member 5